VHGTILRFHKLLEIELGRIKNQIGCGGRKRLSAEN